MNIHEKTALAEKLVPALGAAVQVARPVGSFLWGSLTPKWMWPVFAGVTAAPFLGHALKERRERKENYIKRLYMQRRLGELQAQAGFFGASPLMREAESAVGEALGKTAQMDPSMGGMPGGTPGAGGPPMPPPLLAGYKPPSAYPPLPTPMALPPERLESGLNLLRKSLRDAKLRAGKKRTRSLGLDNAADWDDSDRSLDSVVKRRREGATR